MTRALPLALAALLGALLAVAAVTLPGGGSATADRDAAASGRWQSPDRSFSLQRLPRGWRTEHGPAATVLQRADRKATVVVRRGDVLRGTIAELHRGLERRLRAELGDIRPVAARELPAGDRRGLLYTFVRPATGTVQSIAVVPTAEATFTLDAVVDGGDEAVAREVGNLVRSFSPAA